MLFEEQVQKNYELRGYQAKLVNDTLFSLADNGNTMLQAATGAGKTIMFIDIIRRCWEQKRYRTLVLAHRDELIKQCQKSVFKFTGIRAGIIKGSAMTDYRLPCQIASVQTLRNRPMPPDIKLIIVDEAHHATAATYINIFKAYPNALILGVTATPIRTNGQGFEHVFNNLICGPQIKWCEDQGYLNPAYIPEVFLNSGLVKGLDRLSTEKGGLVAGDYNQKRLKEVIRDSEIANDAVGSKLKFAKGLPTIGFCLDVEDSERTAQRMQDAGIPAAHVDGKTDENTRKRIFADLEKNNGTLEYVSNVGIATEGTDIPCVQCVQLLRPTKSLALYLQMVGRGSRLYPGKDKYVFLDHVGGIIQHGKPNNDRTWTLSGQGKTKGESYRKFEVTYHGGKTAILDSRRIPKGKEGLRIVKIQEIEQSYRTEVIDRIANNVRKNNWKPYSIYYRFSQQVGWDISNMELEYLAKTIGVKGDRKRWIKREQMKRDSELAKRNNLQAV